MARLYVCPPASNPPPGGFSLSHGQDSELCSIKVGKNPQIIAGGGRGHNQTATLQQQQGRGSLARDDNSQRLPPSSPTRSSQVLLCDPMLATGGSALMAIRCLVEAGVKESAVVFVTVVVCPEVR